MLVRMLRMREPVSILIAGSLWLLASSSQVHADGPDRVAATKPAEPTAEAKPTRPPLGDMAQRAELLFHAIVHDDPERAREVFFPEEPFLRIKDMAHPERYYARLRARFDKDIHALHASLGDLSDARFERLELTRRGGYVLPGEEGNKLPYWAARHAFLHYHVHGVAKKLEVRVLITWEGRWYVIHLSEFH